MTATQARPQVLRTPSRRRPRSLVVAVRPRQWLKNVLVIGAPLAAGRLLQPRVSLDTAIAFVAMCLAASATYLINDVHDAAEDRGHPRKRHRPVAAGDLSKAGALAAAAVLALAGLAVAVLASPAFALVVAAYLAMTLAYTIWLRGEPVVELVVVAAGFVLRGAAGGVAAGLAVSSWFLLVAGFGSLFLVSGKRYAERVGADDRDGVRVRTTLSVYTPSFLRFVWTSAATLTIACYALWASQVYLVRDEGSWALLSLAPFLLALLRYALDLDRGTAEAPEEVLLHDRALLILGLVWIAMLAVGAGGFDLGL
ncbi:MAG TPA: decaprenyl-phosphate phosphoribosyltransferase [Kineosporiaceae bacterium]|nr:decaprenyl-phosphate phosphoribosyltransferase [Kineosporiaceae bacterium]